MYEVGKRPLHRRIEPLLLPVYHSYGVKAVSNFKSLKVMRRDRSYCATNPDAYIIIRVLI